MSDSVYDLVPPFDRFDDVVGAAGGYAEAAETLKRRLAFSSRSSSL